jgi:HSP20 family molecular chaperone IbpA
MKLENLFFPILNGKKVEEIFENLTRGMEEALDKTNLGFPFTDMWYEESENGNIKAVIEIAAAGYDKMEDISITFDSSTNQIIIIGDKGINIKNTETNENEVKDNFNVEDKEKETKKRYINKNISYRKFIRTATFHRKIDESSIKASSKNGILRVELMEIKDVPKQKINID